MQGCGGGSPPQNLPFRAVWAASPPKRREKSCGLKGLRPLKGFHHMIRLQVQFEHDRECLRVTAQALLPGDADLEQAVLPATRWTVVDQGAVAALDHPAPNRYQPQVGYYQRQQQARKAIPV